VITDYFVAFVVLLSILIFVHELGHFLAAKACGVRVLKFSIGFGPAIGLGRHRLYWKRGHTEYVVAWFPLGGFVKMLGENPEDEDDPETRAHPEETLGAKRLWQKLLIVFAGPAMNLILPVFLFVGMQAVGLPRADAVIGLVEAGSPAEAAGLRPGDRLVAVGGEPVHWWSDVATAIQGHPDEKLPLEVERDGQTVSVPLAVGAREGFDEYGVITEVGWAGLGHARPTSLLGILDLGSPAHAAGLRSGDRVTAVGGQPVEDWYEFAERYAAAPPGGRVEVSVARRVAGEPETLRFEVPALGSVEALGVVPASALVSDVVPDSPAAKAGIQPGDLILEYDGRPVTYFSSFAQAVATSGGRPIPLVVARDGVLHEITVAAEPIATDTGFGIEESRYRIGIMGSESLVAGAVATDRERNPFVALPRAVAMTVDFTRVFLVGLGKLASGEVSRKNLAGPIGIAEIAGKALQQGWEPYLRIMILISINLGILNLLPIPVLDGGQALLFSVEALKRAPLSTGTKLAVQQIGVTVLVLLMGLAFWNDLSRVWARVVDWLPSGL
jgi:regulator of sigma E protease